MSTSSGESRPCMGIPGGVIALLLILGGMIGTFAACGGLPTGGSSGNATATAQAVATARAQSNTTATAQALLNATATVQAQASATAQAQAATATAAPRVTITFPTEGSTVGITIIAQGTAPNIPQGEKLWLLVYVEGINGYFPQDGPINVLNDGTWSADTAIGGPNDAGRHFVLLAALADQQGEATLEQYIKSGHASGSFPAIPLPKGVQVISQVHVVRQ